MRWRESWRADPASRRVIDNHYSRQTVGAAQFVPPGRCVVFVIHESDHPEVATWVTSWPFPEYVKHAWPGAWICSAFRNQRADLNRSSELITEALAGTRWYWEPPDLGMITFVDPTKIRHKRDPGRCFRKAGFHVAGKHPGCRCTPGPSAAKDGKLALHIAPSEMPTGVAPIGAQISLL